MGFYHSSTRTLALYNVECKCLWKSICNLKMYMSKVISPKELIIKEPHFISSVLAAVTIDLSL